MVQSFIKRLKNNDKTLTELDLILNKIGAEEAKAFAEALAKNTSLMKLSFRGNNIDAGDLLGEMQVYLERNKTIADYLTKLKQIDVHQNTQTFNDVLSSFQGFIDTLASEESEKIVQARVQQQLNPLLVDIYLKNVPGSR